MGANPTPVAPAPADEGTAGARLFVWAVWLAMTAAGAWFVPHCTTNTPYWDEWSLVPLATGRQPIDLPTLWQPVNEHRLPLIKVMLIGLWTATGDFRSQAWLNFALLAGTAAGAMRLACKLRGRPAYADAFFPVAFLHWGVSEFYVGTITLNHLLASVLQGLVLAVILLRPGGPGWGMLAALAGCLVAMPLCGANGLPVSLAAAAWLGWVAGWDWRAGRPGRAAACLAVAAVAVGLVWFYFRGFHRPGGLPPSDDPLAVIRVAAQALSMTCVGWQPQLWPAIGYAVPAALLAGAGLAVVGGLRGWSTERLRVPGLLLVLAASASQAGAIGWSRAASQGPEAGAALRYGIALMPAVAAAYFAAVLYERRAWRGLLPTFLMALVVAFLPIRMTHGWAASQVIKERVGGITRDAKNGATIDYLAEKYGGVVSADAVELEACLRDLHGKRFGALSKTTVSPDNLQTRPVDLPPPAVAHELTGGPARWVSAGKDPHLAYNLAPPYLPAVRSLKMTYRLKVMPAAPFARAEVFWVGRDGEIFTPAERHWARELVADDQVRTATIWVDGPVRSIRIDPADGPCEFELIALSATTPAP